MKLYCWITMLLLFVVSCNIILSYEGDEPIIVDVDPSGAVFVNQTMRVYDAPTTITIIPVAPVAFIDAYYIDGEPTAFEYNGTHIVILADKNGTIILKYVSLNATSFKAGIWRLNLTLSDEALVLLPKGSIAIHISPDPEYAIKKNGRIGLVFKPGDVYIEYIISIPSPSPQMPAPPGATHITSTPYVTPSPTPAKTVPGGAEVPYVPWNYVVPLIVVAALIAIILVVFKRKSMKTSNYKVLDERDRTILNALKRLGMAGLSTLSKETGIPKTPLHRRLKKLVSMGIVEEIEIGRTKKYRLKK